MKLMRSWRCSEQIESCRRFSCCRSSTTTPLFTCCNQIQYKELRQQVSRPDGSFSDSFIDTDARCHRFFISPSSTKTSHPQREQLCVPTKSKKRSRFQKKTFPWVVLLTPAPLHWWEGNFPELHRVRSRSTHLDKQLMSLNIGERAALLFILWLFCF